jgi:Ribophorin I
LKPRFSLLGDWNCTWELAHNIPTDDVLSKKIGSNTYKFEYGVAHLLHRVSSDVYELRVALPEGAKILSHNIIKGAQPTKVGHELSYSYLDFLGRPTLVFTFDNYLPRINLEAKLVIEYTLADHLMFIEPAYLVCGLMLLFGIYLCFSKMDLSFGNEELQEQLEAKGAVPAAKVAPSQAQGSRNNKSGPHQDKKQK